MKVIKSISVCLFIVLLITGCNRGYQSPEVLIAPYSNDNYTGEITVPGIQSMIEDDENYTLSVFFPITGDDFIDEILSQYAQAQVELYKQEVSELGTSHREEWPYELHLTYTVARDDSNYYALLFESSKYLGGVQSTDDTITFNFDRRAQRQLSLSDLFDDENYLETLSNITYDVIKNEELIPRTVDVNWTKGGLMPELDNFKHFLLQNDGIDFLFDLYQLGPAYLGSLRVLLPYEMLSEHIELNGAMAEALPEQSGEDDVFSLESSQDYTAIVPAIPEDSARKIAITFEDGPHPIYTPIILDALSARNTPAAFFCLGNRVYDYPELAARIAGEGHLLGNHTLTHPQLTRRTADILKAEFETAQTLILEVTGNEPVFFRPPYGLFNEDVLSEIPLPFVLWSIDPQDRVYQDSDYIVNYIVDHAFDGAIIRLHDNYGSTAQAVGPLIDALTSAGYTLVSLDALLPQNVDSGVYTQGVD